VRDYPPVKGNDSITFRLCLCHDFFYLL